MIEQEIAAQLRGIEQKEKVKILCAVESGSRAWGFASPDSDYDVRFVYVRPLSQYLRLQKTRDVIEWQLDDVLDINGWDLQKMLRLLHKSNPTIFEWSNSDIVYRTSPEWQTLLPLIQSSFQSKAGLYHYLSTAHGNYREYLQGPLVRLKKYFYVLRPLLACKWILARHCPPPMPFAQLAEAMLEPEIQPAVRQLLAQKQNTSELGEGRRVDLLNRYIERSLGTIERALASMGPEPRQDWAPLEQAFYDIVRTSGLSDDR